VEGRNTPESRAPACFGCWAATLPAIRFGEVIWQAIQRLPEHAIRPLIRKAMGRQIGGSKDGM
jgi:hypothetical protein